MRLSYPTTIKIIRVPCTGKVDILHIMRAFEKGADGACVIGCLEGECHFNSGNLMAKRRVTQASQILDTIGVGGERAKMYNLSSSEGPLFAKYATEFTEIIRELGPNPLKLMKNKQILSPMPKGNGAYIAHRLLETQIQEYRVVSFNQNWTFIPFMMIMLLAGLQALPKVE